MTNPNDTGSDIITWWYLLKLLIVAYEGVSDDLHSHGGDGDDDWADDVLFIEHWHWYVVMTENFIYWYDMLMTLTHHSRYYWRLTVFSDIIMSGMVTWRRAEF